jgi:hypothetical protein
VSESASTSRALHQALGDEPADEMIDRINQLEQSRAEHRELIDLRFDRFEGRIDKRFAEQDAKLEKIRADLLKWMFLGWIGAVGTIASVIVGVMGKALR